MSFSLPRLAWRLASVVAKSDATAMPPTNRLVWLAWMVLQYELEWNTALASLRKQW